MKKVFESSRELRDFVFEGDDEFDVIEEGDFIQDYKYQHATSIYLHKESGKYYAFDMSRSGSYHSDWYYDFEDDKELNLYEVKKIEITKTIWKAI